MATEKLAMNHPPRLLRDGLLASADLSPDKTAIIVGDKSYTYSELLNAANCIAYTLVENGVQSGDRVAIYMDNTWECVVSIYAALLAGATFLTINPQTKADKLKYILQDSEAKVLISDSHLRNVFTSVLDDTTKIVALISSGDVNLVQNINHHRVLDFEQIILGAKQLPEPVENNTQ